MGKGLKSRLALISLLALGFPGISRGESPKKPHVEDGQASGDPPKPKRKLPYHFVGVLGVDTTVGARDSWVVPIARALGYMEFGTWDLLLKADSLGASVQVDNRSNLGAGVRVVYDAVAHGDYRHFVRGERDRGREVTASMLGGEAFAHLGLGDFEARLAYTGGWKFYGNQDETTRPLPPSHAVHDLALGLSYTDLETRRLVVKDGLDVKLHVSHQRRPGFDDSEDATPEEDGGTTKAHLYFGWFETFAGDNNLQLEARVGTEDGADRQNAWYLGGFVSRHAPAPGTSYMEVRHAPFVQGSIQFGFDLGPWDTRLQPGVHALLLPGDNQVRGGEDYGGDVVPSGSLVLTGKLFGAAPFAVKLGRVLDAEDSSFEVMGCVAVAAGKLP